MCARPIEWIEERLQAEAHDLIEYAKDPNSLSFERFTCLRDEPYARETLYKLVNKSESFRYAFIRAKELIRLNREHAVATGKMHQAVYNRTASFYDREQSLTEESLSGHLKDMDRAKRNAQKDDTVDTLKAANDAIQGLSDE